MVIYSCNPGLIPEGEFRSVCREGTDTWDPDPASAMCREPGTTGIRVHIMVSTIYGLILVHLPFLIDAYSK